MLGLTKVNVTRNQNSDPDKYTHIYSFTLLRWDPVTLRKDVDKKQNSNKQLLGRQLVDHKWCALQKTQYYLLLRAHSNLPQFLINKDGFENRTHIH